MNTKIRLLAKTLTAIGLLLFSSVVFAEMLIVVNRSNDVALNANSLKKIYLGKMKRFPNGKEVKTFSLSEDNPNREDFLTKVVGKDGVQFNAYWAKLVFTGKGTPPTELSDEADIMAAIARDPGGIGFVSADANVDAVRVAARVAN